MRHVNASRAIQWIEGDNNITVMRSIQLLQYTCHCLQMPSIQPIILIYDNLSLAIH